MNVYKDMSDQDLNRVCTGVLTAIGMHPEECVREGVADAWGRILTNPQAKKEVEGIGAKSFGDWIQVCKRIAPAAPAK